MMYVSKRVFEIMISPNSSSTFDTVGDNVIKLGSIGSRNSCLPTKI